MSELLTVNKDLFLKSVNVLDVYLQELERLQGEALKIKEVDIANSYKAQSMLVARVIAGLTQSATSVITEFTN